ncbi:MAG: hypothetical protein KJZ57_00060 [Anaerolineales bacterium]|nr:hypothetical protein [Anaerolineales bacterium]
MIADWIDAELRNWSAWCWSGAWPHPIPPDHCRSIEHQWIDPSDLYREAPEPRPIAPNRQRAEIVDRVFMERLTQTERWALIHRYVRRTEERITLRRMRVSRDVYETTLRNAARKVGEAFRESRIALRA